MNSIMIAISSSKQGSLALFVQYCCLVNQHPCLSLSKTKPLYCCIIQLFHPPSKNVSCTVFTILLSCKSVAPASSPSPKTAPLHFLYNTLVNCQVAQPTHKKTKKKILVLFSLSCTATSPFPNVEITCMQLPDFHVFAVWHTPASLIITQHF